MIVVLKHGNEFLKAQCPKCSCLFKFEIADMQTHGNQIDMYESIKCPDCGYEITWWYGEKSKRNCCKYPYN